MCQDVTEHKDIERVEYSTVRHSEQGRLDISGMKVCTMLYVPEASRYLINCYEQCNLKTWLAIVPTHQGY